MLTRLFSAAIQGVDAIEVEVEVKVIRTGSNLINMICDLLAGGASLVEQEGQVTPGSHVKGICNPAHGHGRFPTKSLGDFHLLNTACRSVNGPLIRSDPFCLWVLRS